MANLTINEFLFKLENPQVYSGLEINVVKKDFYKSGTINICLVFPDKYEIGMSHYGLKLLYHMLNRMDNVNAERCFLPGKNSIAMFKKYDFPLFSLENKIPLKDFHLIGFSLLSEMNYTNVLQILDLAKIPLYTKKREAEFPIIAAGGISSINPEPLRDFIDIFAIGDGEALFPDMLDVISVAIEKKLNKIDTQKLFAEIEGIYVPSLSKLKKSGRFYLPDLKPGEIKKRVFKEIDDSFPDEKMIVPITNVVFDRLTLEIARGCPQNCRFCQAKSYYAPFRSKSLDKIFSYIKHALPATGFDGFSLSSLSSGDYPQLNELLELIPTVTQPGVSFSVSSLRPATISGSLLATLSLFRRTGLTIVPEAGSGRLRRVINKNVTDEEIYKAVDLALKHNWQKIKLYFMIGLPTETMEDIQAITALVEKIVLRVRAGKKKIKMHISFSPFVPKPHTPLQWARRESRTEILKKIDYIKENLGKYKKVELDFHDPRNSIVETILARGDRRVGDLLFRAFEEGEIFSAWDWDFHFPVWEKLLKGSDCNEFLQEIAPEEPLPWDFIRINYKKEHLLEEYEKALSGTATLPCSGDDCEICRGCLYPLPKKKPEKKIPASTDYKEDKTAQSPAEKLKGVEKKYNKIRIFYEKKDGFIYFSQISMLKYIERLIRKSGIEFKCSEGFHPRIKIATLAPLPVFAASLEEVAELYVDPFLTGEEILEKLSRSSGLFKFKKVVVCSDSPKLSRDLTVIEYVIALKNLSQYKEEIEKHMVSTDSATYLEDKLILKIDYNKQGQERFARIYKIFDPERKFTRFLTRTRVEFKSLS
jgi:radical SAM family uncharacterized protein/radical SAM-linked protein